MSDRVNFPKTSEGLVTVSTLTRIVHGLSVAELARKLFCDPNDLALWERRVKPMPEATIKRMSLLFAVPLQALRGRDLTEDSAREMLGHFSGPASVVRRQMIR